MFSSPRIKQGLWTTLTLILAAAFGALSYVAILNYAEYEKLASVVSSENSIFQNLAIVRYGVVESVDPIAGTLTVVSPNAYMNGSPESIRLAIPDTTPIVLQTAEADLSNTVVAMTDPSPKKLADIQPGARVRVYINADNGTLVGIAIVYGDPL